MKDEIIDTSGATDGWSNWRTRALPEGDWLMRTGNKIGRNLYIEWPDGRSEPVGQVDTVALATLICDTINTSRLVVARRHRTSRGPVPGNGTHIIGNTVAGDINVTGLQ